jgi:hypothetical protein
MVWLYAVLFILFWGYRTIKHHHGLFVGDQRVFTLSLLVLPLVVNFFPPIILWYTPGDVCSIFLFVAWQAQVNVLYFTLVAGFRLTLQAYGKLRTSPTLYALIYYYWREILKHYYVGQLVEETTKHRTNDVWLARQEVIRKYGVRSGRQWEVGDHLYRLVHFICFGMITFYLMKML